MSVRVQVILDDKEAAWFKTQAKRESKSLSAWLGEAGRKMLKESPKRHSRTDHQALDDVFEACNARETGRELDWEEQKALLLEGFQADKRL